MKKPERTKTKEIKETTEQEPKNLNRGSYSVDDIRHSEYYQMQEVFDDLYKRSKNGEEFKDLRPIIFSRNNILLAYRNMKANHGSMTPGTDGKKITDIGKLTPEEVVENVLYRAMSHYGYRPAAVKRVDIPKGKDKTRPLGIPAIWDRLIQQCVKQVLEPICEAKFSENSHGFRPERSQEHAIAALYRLMQLQHLHYVVELDIKGFFDNVNHSKLKRQIWAMGIHDKGLIYIISQILKAPIKMPDGTIVHPTKGTPQGGILSPLLANIVLNEFDHWLEEWWEEHPMVKKYAYVQKNGTVNKGDAYKKMRESGLMEVHAVRFADDVRVLCPDRETAEKIKHSCTKYLKKRLRLDVSPEKTRIVNTRRQYSEFLGFKIKVHKKGLVEKKGKDGKIVKEPKWVVKSHMSDKALKRETEKLIEQAKRIQHPVYPRTERDESVRYDSMVAGIQNYYRLATEISKDCAKIQRRVSVVFKNRLKERGKNARISKEGRDLRPAEKKSYGKSKMLRYAKESGEPIYPIGYVQAKKPMHKKKAINRYTPEGRDKLHDNLKLNVTLMWAMALAPSYDRSTEYMDNRISLFSAQWGKCAVSGEEFFSAEFIHCHHIVPKHMGGGDNYQNLILVSEGIHWLIHATDKYTIECILKAYKLNKRQFAKLNWLRKQAGNEEITRPE